MAPRLASWITPPAARWTALGLTAVTVTSLAVLSPGYDVQESPAKSHSVWVSRDSGQYARVNTAIGEFDAVRSVAEPSQIVQSSESAVLLGQGLVRAWELNPADPLDLLETGQDADAAALAEVDVPQGSSVVASAGNTVAYLTAAGEIYAGQLSSPGGARTAARIDPFAQSTEGEDQAETTYVAHAVAVAADGRIAVYSETDSSVRVYDSTSGTWSESVDVIAAPAQVGAELAMTFAGDAWVLYAPATSELWADGLGSPVDLSLPGEALLQASESEGNEVLLADSQGLYAVNIDNAVIRELAQGQGTPAAPVTVQGVAYAAWVSATSAQLWTSTTQAVTTLEVDAEVLSEVRSVAPRFNYHASAVVLSESSTGMVWTLPDGQLIPLDAWQALDDTEQVTGEQQVDDVANQEPPVARADSFGVRRGQVVMLPVLLNDSDPNAKDVLSIDPDSVSALSDSSFGTLSVVAQQQQLAIRVSAASGTATFTYSATDGLNSSEPVRVTLTVVPDSVNTAPQWCPVDDCTQAQPSIDIVPGGFTKVPVMAAWVDAEGDALVLADARSTDPTAPISVLATADGQVAVRHLDPNGASAQYPITVTVMDAYGATSDFNLGVNVSANPALRVKPIALASSPSMERKVAIADWTSGGSGSYRLVDASASGADAESLTIVLSPADGTFTLAAAEPGSYIASYTVEDTKTLAQQTATVRLTVDSTNLALAIAPLTTSVRQGQDTTVDILAAVAASSDRVLRVESASSSNPALTVDIVDQRSIRLRATTPNSTAGPLGLVELTVTDAAGSSASTQLTVFLAPGSRGQGPIAVPDVIATRAGSQIDIKVLDNDISARGERLSLHPDVTASGTPGELAFATRDAIRYLAPTVPGTYTVTYSSYVESDPTILDTATVTITVTPPGANRAPAPSPLTALATTGSSVRIPVSTLGVDPDGDKVTLTGVSQPPVGQGVASISATSAAIIYTAPANTLAGGQTEFSYTVTDAQGLSSQAVVRVGVVPASLDNAPVTYADYISIRVGSGAATVITPLANDSDPSGGELRLTSIRPLAVEGTREYSRLAAMLDTATSLDDGVVALRPATTQGLATFVYTVESTASSSNAEGLIVVNTTANPAPDMMVISDTVLNAVTRYDLESGVDVVTGKVDWPTGDPATLTLSLWDDTQGEFTAQGRTISGPIPEQGAVVPFKITGLDTNGEEHSSYGFLRIPPFESMRPQLKAGLDPVVVGEEASVDFTMTELLQLSPRDTIEVRQGDNFVVQRSNSQCVPRGADSIRYTAGREAPWTDTCSVAIRLAGQESWNIIAVPIRVIPKDPQAILSPLSRTIVPGGEQSIDLFDTMLSWEGGRVGDLNSLNLQVAGAGGDAFEYVQSGNEIVVKALADAVPGTRVTIAVTSSAYGGLRSTITLVVGAAVPDSPRGAVFTQQCDVTSSSCVVTVVGLPSEYDPFAGRPGGGLQVSSIGNGGTEVACPVATITQISSSQLRATWPAGLKPEGGQCIVDFEVLDAQQRAGQGTVTFDIRGYPQSPASIVTTGYTAESATLSVALGRATTAYPAITGVTLWEGSTQVPNSSCSSSGPTAYSCTVTGLVNGERHTYTARTVNAIGDSSPSSPVTTWSYLAPTISEITASTLYQAGLTTVASGAVTLNLTGASDIAAYKVVNSGAIIDRTADTTTATIQLPVGPTTITVVPISTFTPPLSGIGSDGSAATVNLTVAGAPSYSGTLTASASADSIAINALALSANFSSAPSSEVYYLWTTQTPTCSMSDTGLAQVTGGADLITSADPTITGLTVYTEYFVGVCGSNGFGTANATVAGTVYTWTPPSPPAGPLNYNVGSTPRVDGQVWIFDDVTAPVVTAPDGFTVTYFYDGASASSAFALDSGVVRSISVAYCSAARPELCSDPTPIEPAAAPTTVTLTAPAACVETPNATDILISNAASPFAAIDPDMSAFYRVTFSGPFASLDPVEIPVNICPPPVEPPPGG